MPIDDSYVEVPERIREFREKYPGGSLRPVNANKPFDIVTIGDKTFIAYTAVAVRGPDDTVPGVGCAWEPFPGQTNFTRNSELQNAETSAWGRAIIASLAADAKKVATATEVRNRQAEQQQPTEPAQPARRMRPPPKPIASGPPNPRVTAIKERLHNLDEEHFAWARDQAMQERIPAIDGPDIKDEQLAKLEELITIAELDQSQALPIQSIEDDPDAAAF